MNIIDDMKMCDEQHTTESYTISADNLPAFTPNQDNGIGSLGIKEETLENFEIQFKEKYKVDFQDFIEVILKDYPELRI